jgi:heavy metal translocating P-type ATPase
MLSLAIITIIVGLILQLLHFHTAVNYLLAIVSLLECLPLIKDLYDDLRSGKYGIDILALTAIIASVLLRQYWAGIVVVLMIVGGESLEEYANERAKHELSALLNNAPAIAHLIQNGKVSDIKARDIKVGDKFIVKPGELVPADSIIIEGHSSFDESSLTGESVPVEKDDGSKLLSGSINIEGLVTAKATASASDSQYQQIIKLVTSAANSQAPFVRLADRYSIPFTVIAYAIGATVWVYYGHAIRFLEVIIVATPCPLLIATPVALLSGMVKASSYGIIIKSGTALERLAEAKTFAFDKTGTLTTGKLSVEKVKSFNGLSTGEVLSLAAGMEQFSTHIIGQTISTEAKDRGIKLAKIKKQQEISGKGLVASYKGGEVIAGNLSLLQDHNVVIPKEVEKANLLSTTVYIATNDKLAGYITLSDKLRPKSKYTIDELKDAGIVKIMMITGDNQAVANDISKKLGISDVVANALPGDKLSAIEKQDVRPVAFVGDGVNDAPVLTAADIGIALGARGSTAASESADIVVMPDDISRVASAYKIAKFTFKIARQSILVGISLSVVLMLIFASGRFLPLYGAILQEAVDVLVIFYALRAHSFKLKT